MKIDLHCHTQASDGQLSLSELLRKAASKEISLLSITDHDTVAAYQALRINHDLISQSILQAMPQIYAGVEISCQWSNMDVHIVGLDIDIDNDGLNTALRGQADLRQQRAERIASKLATKGILNTLDDCQRLAKAGNIGRPHFAQVLVERGVVRDFRQAFDKYLATGKAAYSQTAWPTVAEAVSWIQAAGGQAVLAHPLRYHMTNTKLKRLILYFSESGGAALELTAAEQNNVKNKDRQRQMFDLCREFSLSVSLGSDFHSEQQWQQLGVSMEIPKGLRGVWESFGESFLRAC